MDRLTFKLLAMTALLLGSFVTDSIGDNLRVAQFKPNVFVENQGQWPDSVLFRADVAGAVVWLTRGGVVYQIFSDEPEQAGLVSTADGAVPDSQRCRLVAMQLVGANQQARVEPQSGVPAQWNYLYGRDQKRWRTHVNGYTAVEVSNIYPGIDVRYYTADGKLEYDLIVAPGADLSQVRQMYFGNTDLAITADGDLILQTEAGNIVERAPRVIDGGSDVRAAFVLRDGRSVGFRLDGAEGKEEPVRIDPVVDFSAIFGGSGGDPVQAIVTDDSGYIYVAGTTYSADFPVKNAFDSTYFSMYFGGDVYVMKLSPSADSLIYATYIGGTYYEGDYCSDLVVDANHCATVTGTTGDYDFPAVGGFDSTYNSGIYDGFLAKLGPDGDTLLYGAYLGGGGGGGLEGIRAGALDADGNVWVVGYTEGPGYPMVNPLQGTFGGQQDVVITKVAANGKSILYSTYFGGSLVDYAYGCAVLPDGALAVVGYSNSPELFSPWLPTPSVPAGDHDGFLAVVSPDGTTIEHGRFFGGSAFDECTSVGVSPEGHLVVAGLSMSPDLPMVSPIFPTHSGSRDIFVADFGTTGDSLLFSTYFGGSSSEFGWMRHLLFKEGGRVYLVGSTLSPNLPQVDPLDGTLGGPQDGLLAEFDIQNHALIFSTLFGGDGYDAVTGATWDPRGGLLLCGTSTSIGFLQPESTSWGVTGNGDSFVMRLMECCIGSKGDLDQSSVIDLVDLGRLVGYLTGRGRPRGFCFESANIDGTGIINLVDLVLLVTYLTEPGAGPLPACP